MTLPRLTRFLRSLDNGSDLNQLNDVSKSNLLREKRELNLKLEQQKTLNWNKLSSAIRKYCKECDSVLKTFLKHAKNIGSISISFINSNCHKI